MDNSVKSFHANCLLPWNTKNCPICYYIQYPDLLPNSDCMNCKANSSLWFCIVCGHIGCGKGLQAHALEHYKCTQHKYVMGLKGFKVWDYKLKKYLHKLGDGGQNSNDLQKFSKPNDESNCKCPICQNSHTLKLLNQPACMKCKQSHVYELWICLFCSHVGCSKNLNRHAMQHYTRTQHPYVMNLVNFSIWDYKEQKYLHRYMHDKMSPTSDVAENIAQRMDRLELQWQEFIKLKESSHIITQERLAYIAGKKRIFERKLFAHDTKLNELFIQFAYNRKHISPLKLLKPKKSAVKAEAMKKPKLQPKQDLVVAKPQASLLPTKSLRNHTVTYISSNLTDFMPFFILGLVVIYFLRLCLKAIAACLHHLF